MSTLARAQPGTSPATKSMVRTPPPVATVKRGGATRPPSTAAWARQRIPLPLISASPPSALRSSMERSQPWRPGPTRMIPSAPIPRRRSQSRRTWPTERRRVSAGSRTTMKSLPAPSCFGAVHPYSLAVQDAARAPCGPVALPSGGPLTGAESAPPRDRSRRSGDHAGTRRPGAGQRPGAPHGLVHAVGQGHPLFHVGQQLAVAQGLTGGPRNAAWALGQRPHLLEEPLSIQRAKRSAMRRSTSSLERSPRP